MTNCEQCRQIDFLYAYCFACIKKYQLIKMLWLSFPKNRCYCSSKTFVKCVGLVVQIWLPIDFWCLGVFRSLSTKKRLLQEIIQLQKLQYSFVTNLQAIKTCLQVPGRNSRAFSLSSPTAKVKKSLLLWSTELTN